MALTDDFLTHFTELMTKSTETSTPYANTIQYIKDSFDDYNITDKEKAELIINYMIQSTTQITATAMQMSLQAVERETKLPLETESLTIQNATLQLEQDRIALEKTKAQYEVDYFLPLQKDKLTQEKAVLEQQVAEFTYKIANIFPKELEKMEEEIDLLQSQDADVLAKTAIAQEQSTKDLALKDAQITGIGYENSVKAEQVTMSAYEREFIQPKQLEKATAEIASLTKDSAVKDAQIASMSADDTVKAKQALLIEEQTKSEAKQNELDGVIDTQKASMLKDIDIKTAQITSMTKDDLIKDAQILGITKDNEVKTQQIAESTYRVANILPKELEKATAEIALMGKDGDLKDGQILGITKDNEVKDAQITKISKENLLIQAEVDIKTDAIVVQAMKDRYSAETDVLEKDIEVKTAQITDIASQTASRESLTTADVSLKGTQREGIIKDNLVKDAQILGITKDNEVKDAQVTKISKENLLIQAEVDIKTDPIVVQAQKDTVVNAASKIEKESTVLDKQALNIASQTSIAELQSNNDTTIKTKQADLIEKQSLTEEAKKALTNRQVTAYDDNLRDKEAELLANVTGMFGMGGNILPDGLLTAMFDAIDDITPA